MLREVSPVKQHAGEMFRRWFNDDQFDLIVWYDRQRHIAGFQLCYDKPKRERALTWLKATGFSHRNVDAGEGGPWEMGTPLLTATAPFPLARVRAGFVARSRQLEPAIVACVLQRLDEYLPQTP